MADILSQEEIDQLLTAIGVAGDSTDGARWHIVIDYQTFCSRLDSYGFDEKKLTQAKAALLEAELMYRFLGRAKKSGAAGETEEAEYGQF
jgi:hypothetical protein